MRKKIINSGNTLRTPFPIVFALVLYACQENSNLYSITEQSKADTNATRSIVEMAGEKMIILQEAIQPEYSDFQFWWSKSQRGKVFLVSKFYVSPMHFFKTDSMSVWGDNYIMIISDFIFNDITDYIDSVHIAFFTDKGINKGKSMFERDVHGSQLDFQLDFDGKDAIRSRLALFGKLINKEFSIAFESTAPTLKLHILMPQGVAYYRKQLSTKKYAKMFARFVYLYVLKNIQKDYSDIILHFPQPKSKDEKTYPFQTTDTLFSNIYRRPRYGNNHILKDTVFIRD